MAGKRFRQIVTLDGVVRFKYEFGYEALRLADGLLEVFVTVIESHICGR